MFLPDCNAQFNSQRINNIRKALRHDQVIQDFFNAFDEKNALLEKYSNPSQFGYVNIPVQEARAVQFKIAESQKKLIQLPSLNVNDLCYCGSGLKYKHCCL